jgi:hypothetical protein
MREDGGRSGGTRAGTEIRVRGPRANARFCALARHRAVPASAVPLYVSHRPAGASRKEAYAAWPRMLLVAAVLSSALAGCAASTTPFPVKQVAEPPAPTSPPADGPRMRILDLEEYPTDSPGWVVVVGTVENGGLRPTEEIRITVSALGAGDRVVTSSPATARSQEVAPRGRTSFAAVFAQRPEVEAYHVKVLAW